MEEPLQDSPPVVPAQEPNDTDKASTEPSSETASAGTDSLATTSLKPPSLCNSFDNSPSNMSASSAPLGPLNAARRPGPPPSRASGLTSDIQAKMKAFSLSRQGAPPGQSLRSGPQGRPNLASSDSNPGSSNPLTGGISSHNTPATPSGAMAGGLANLRIPQGMSRPGAPTFNSAPIPGGQSPRMMSPRPGMSGLAAKRGLKPGGMKLSDAAGPPTAAATAQKTDTGSQFNQFANIIDTQKGTLNFANKAVIHGGGIDFSSGTSFQISLDEVDTVDELGKGNYGTVYKVKHSRPKMRRPGMGLRGNMSRTSTSSSLDSVDSTASAPAATGTGLIMAMKEIRLELDNAKFAAIIMELDVLHRCVSPFIIDFYGAFFQEGAVYICMENMDGGSIDKLYGDGIPEPVLRKITLSTVMGLKVLKDEHNIIHRDVKPTNILVNTKGQVKICDFGVSGNLVASIAKTNIGCQSYMAPERISGGGVAQAGANPGGGTYSVQSDIWSLGLTIIECAMGRYPYPPETYDNIFSQLNAIVDGEPPDLPAENYSEAARDFVRGCLNKIPRLRPTYAMLIRHGWLSPLLKPPTINEDEEAEAAAEAGHDTTAEPLPETADKEVADWVKAAIERKLSGKMAKSEKPALHAAPLDAVPRQGGLGAVNVTNGATEVESHIAPAAAVKLDSPELKAEQVECTDFAGGMPADEEGSCSG